MNTIKPEELRKAHHEISPAQRTTKDMHSRMLFLREVLTMAPGPAPRGDSFLCLEPTKAKWVEIGNGLAVGSGPDNDLILNGRGVSRRHCVISCRDGDVILKDLGSKNGTLVNDNKVSLRILCDGDVVQVCNEILVFQHGSAEASPQAGKTGAGNASSTG